jgi:acetylglutamate kinase
VASLGCDPATGAVLNINADVVATELAVAVGAARLLLLTGAPGVLERPGDEAAHIPSLTHAEARTRIADGRVAGGMIPKLEEAFGALARGVGQVHVLGRLGPGDLVRAVDAPGTIGTVLRTS